MASRRGRKGTIEVTCDRGQTPHDFALGIGLFIMSVAFAFAFVPTAFTFSDTGGGADDAKLAQRSAAQLLANFSAGEDQNTINATATADYFNTTDAEAELQEDLTLPSTAHINITVRPLENDRFVVMTASDESNVQLTAGRQLPGNLEVAKVVRIVQTSNDEAECQPACRLIVGVW